MNALVLQAYNELELVDALSPAILPDEVLIRVKACAICGSDVHGIDGSTGRRIPPLIMGHEASGVIEEIGGAVTGFEPGDRVTFDSTISCGHCPYCRRGQVNLCDNRRVLGVSTGEYRLNGAFAEYVAVPARILYPLPDDVTFVQGAMVEPVSIAFHAITRTPISLNDTAVVIGSGMIGLLLIQLLRISGCGRIIAVDKASEKLSLATAFGADYTCCSADSDVAGFVREHTAGRGADLAFEAVGLTPTVRMAVQALRKGGSATLIGNLKATADLPLQDVVTRQISLFGSCASAGEYPDCLDLIARRKIDVDALVSAVAPLSDGAEWFRRLYRAEPGLMKVVLRP